MSINIIKIRLLLKHVPYTTPLMWILLAFAISYLLFFVYPIFFSDVMNFPEYVPAMKPIGVDLKNTLSIANDFFASKQTIYREINGYAYPPLASILVFPLLLGDLSLAYKIITFVNIICYAMIAFVFPLLTSRERKVTPLIMLIFITGLFSYGFQFELERGQFNVIAAFLCFLAIWIFHYRNKYRYLAYVFFTFSVQLKIYPLIFIVMLINNWRDWKNNLKRFLLLAIINIVALFVLGPKMFVDFVTAIQNHTNNPYIWPGNHSIYSFVVQVSGIFSRHGWTWVNQYVRLAEFVLFALVGGCIFIIMLRLYRHRQKGMNPLLLLVCTIGALLIPSASHDYTLSLLAAPVAIFLSSNIFSIRVKNLRLRILLISLLVIFSFTYFSTLYSYTNKPYYYIFGNNFPALFMMLLIITIFSLMSKPSFERKVLRSIQRGK